MSQAMTVTFSGGDMTVHRIVELDAPFLPALAMLPALTPQRLDENRSCLRPHSLDADET